MLVRKKIIIKRGGESLSELRDRWMPGTWRPMLRRRIMEKNFVTYTIGHISNVIDGNRRNAIIEEEFLNWVEGLKKQH